MAQKKSDELKGLISSYEVMKQSQQAALKKCGELLANLSQYLTLPPSVATSHRETPYLI